MLRVTEIDDFIRLGLLEEEQRESPEALQDVHLVPPSGGNGREDALCGAVTDNGRHRSCGLPFWRDAVRAKSLPLSATAAEGAVSISSEVLEDAIAYPPATGFPISH
jgi:hypothetical protein